MSESMVVGLDLGQSQDFSALAVVDHVRVLTETEAQLEERRGVVARGRHELRVVHLQRWALGTPYDAIVEDVAKVMRTEQLHDSWLLFDATGVGRAVKDMLTAAYLDGQMGSKWPLPRTITGQGQSGHGSTVTKRDLVSTVQVALQQGRLKIAEQLPLREVLERELAAFRLKISAAGRDTYEFKRGDGLGHGDLATAVMLASSLGNWCPMVDEVVPD